MVLIVGMYVNFRVEVCDLSVMLTSVMFFPPNTFIMLQFIYECIWCRLHHPSTVLHDFDCLQEIVIETTTIKLYTPENIRK